MSYLLLVIGFFLLIKGADLFVDGASALSKKFGIPSVVIGLTVVAFGTSLPEAAVSISASLSGNSDISLGNVVGSNIFNLLVVAGFSAVMSPIAIDKGIIKKDFPYSIVAAAALLFLGYNVFTSPVDDMIISKADGAILLLFFAIFMYYTVSSAISSPSKDNDEETEDIMPLWKQLIFIAVGIASICFGGNLVVESASDIARIWGLSESLIGLTIVAVGTSLPELVTSIVASKKGENDIAMGNVIGSNIFNLLFIMGTAAVINPMSIQFKSLFDIIVLIVVSLAVYIITARKRVITRPVGMGMIAVYIAYLIYLILTDTPAVTSML